MKTQKIDVVLPSRIGDSILSIPAIVCLKQLGRKYGNNLKIRALSRPFLVELLSSLGLFECRGMDYIEKCGSIISPSDRAFFVETTNNNFGYFSKEIYGIENKFKKFLKFTHQPVYLSFSARPFPETWEEIKKSFPDGLAGFLTEDCCLPWYSACLFGICLDLGYTAGQVIETYCHAELKCYSGPGTESHKTLNQVQGDNNDYVVFCVEAGYGRKHLNERCWDTEGYFKIAEKCAEDFGVKAVFVGVNKKMPLPDSDYIEDLRGKLSIYELAGVMKSALCYIGNDTGPLHIANLVRIPSVAVYFKDEHMKGFSPVFPELNTKIFRPESIEPIYAEVERVLKRRC